MVKILIATAAILGMGFLFIFNENDMMIENEDLNEEVKESIEVQDDSIENIEQDTVIADYIFPITGPGKIDGTIFYFAGIRKRLVDDEKVDHLAIDIDKFLYVRENDVVELSDSLTIKIIKITNPPHPQIGKVYFNVIQNPE